MKTLMKIQTKIFLRTKASYIIISIFSVLLLTLSIFGAVLVYDTTYRHGVKIPSELPIQIIKYVFYVFILIIISYIAATILYRYKNEGVELILLTKSIKRSTIFFANLLLVFSLSLIYIFILWLSFFVPFLFIFNYLETNSKISFFTFLLASIIFAIFLSSLSSLVSISIDSKMFAFLLGSMPLIALTPFFIVQVAYRFYYESITSGGIKNNFLISKDMKSNKKIINQQPNTQFDSTIEQNHTIHRYDEFGNVKKEHELTEYDNLKNPKNFSFAKIHNVIYPFNLFEYFDSIVKLHSNSIYNKNDINYNYIAHISRADLSNADKKSISFTSAFPKNNQKKIKIALATSKQEMLNFIFPTVYYQSLIEWSNKYMWRMERKEDQEKSKENVNKFLDFLSNFYSNTFLKTIVQETEINNHIEVAKSKKEIYFAKLYSNKTFQKEVIDFLVKEKMFQIKSLNGETLKWVIDLEKSKDDFSAYLNEMKTNIKTTDFENWRILIDYYKRLKIFFEMTATYSFFRYVGENNITFADVFSLVNSEEDNIFSIPSLSISKWEHPSLPKVKSPFTLQEISKDSHYKVSVWVAIPWYISITVLLSLSAGFIALGNWKHNKKTFHI
ncbi:ABC transporter permease [Mycoplasmopsis hyopharyngis]|uniref:ABC transporter permease n=1 Tax=Mycoplasmopsis hyopharyngis TaxID=29558 RepID=UPI0038730F32